MSLVFNMVGGGSSVEPFAAITASYPAGSTCTCSDGTKTFTAPNTSGTALFIVPYAATWTVTATDGTETATETVEISTEGQSVSVELYYVLWLFKNGNQYTDITGGWTDDGYDYGGATKVAPIISNSIILNEAKTEKISLAGTKNKINLTEISTIYFNVTAVTTAIRLDVSTAKTLADSNVARKAVSATGIHSLDVSSLTGEYYLCLCAISASGAAWSGTATEVWGEA